MPRAEIAPQRECGAFVHADMAVQLTVLNDEIQRLLALQIEVRLMLAAAREVFDRALVLDARTQAAALAHPEGSA